VPDFDFAIIGAGAAGLSVASVTAQLGLRVALIERGRMGGDCLNTGCVPSKALLAAAHARLDSLSAARLGVPASAPGPEWGDVQAHVHGVIEAIAPADSRARFEGLGATVIAGKACFAARDALRVDGRTLSARRIVIAAGSRAAVPGIPGLEGVPFLTHETLFDLAARPEHLLILGGGAIGLEMAQAFAGLGSRVTIVQRGRAGSRDDPELVDVLRHVLQGQGVSFLEHVSVERAEPGPVLVLTDGRRIAGSHLLVAAGRVPRTDGLDLERGGVRATPLGVATDAGLRSLSNRRVFAVGDIADPRGIGPRYLTHAASHHAGIVVRRAVFRAPARVDDRAMPRAIYTDPELAQVGWTEAQARAAGRRPEVLRWRLEDNDRAQAQRRTEGLVKLVVAGGRVLGAGIVAPHAGEMIGVWTLAVRRRISLSVIADLIVPYPTLAEAAKRAAGVPYARKLFAGGTRRLAGVLTRLG
jgi:pyruvate/2-oxoglutarate dehydrogenase complex dihydrolipoamide dehydrogenase (E3) component